MRLIDADAIDFRWSNCVYRYKIDSMPTIDAVPVIHAKWEKQEYKDDSKFVKYYFKCSECEFKGIGAGSSFCPHCGAKMDLE